MPSNDGSREPIAQVQAWLDAAGWSQRKLSLRCGFSPAVLSRVLRGLMPIGRRVALEIERITSAAFDSGEVAARPLRAADLRPSSKREAA